MFEYCDLSFCINDLSTMIADDSGRWGTGGLFSALSTRSLKPEEQYKLASKMKDLTLGDTHLVPIDDIQSRESGSDYVCILSDILLIKCQDICFQKYFSS